MRIPLDFYETPKKLTKILLAQQPAITGKILEPCSGHGAIVYHLENQGLKVQATDIKDGNQYDATKVEYWENIAEPANWVVTNPPFCSAIDILKHSLLHAKTGVAMLLRLSFLEPCNSRASTLQEYANNLIQIIPVNPRPKFNPNSKGSDNVTVAWFVWNKNRSWQQLGIRSPFQFVNEWHKS